MNHRDEILKAQQDRIDNIFHSFSEADELEKAREIQVIGAIKTFGGREYIKTPNGWKYHGKGTGAMAQSHVAGAAEHNASQGGESFNHRQFLDHPFSGNTADESKVMAKMNKLVEQGKLTKKQVKSGPNTYTKYSEVAQPTSNASRDLMKPREGKTYEVSQRGKGESAVHELGATDGSHQVDMQFSSPEEAKKFATKHGFPTKETGSTTAAPKYGQTGYSPKSKEQLTADVKENYKRSSLAIQNQKVKEALEKHFPETATSTTPAKPAVTSTSATKNTATVPGGTKIPARGIGGSRSDMIEVPGIQTLAKTPIDNAVKTTMNQLSIAGRTQYLNQAEASIESDKKKARGYAKLTPRQHEEGLRAINNLRRDYVGTTTTEQGNVKMSINPKGEASINGKPIQVDSDSGFVKLGGGGRSSSTGGMYGAGHFDGQLQGGTYVAATKSLIGAIQSGKSIKDAIQHVKQNSTASVQEAFPKVLAHLGLDRI